LQEGKKGDTIESEKGKHPQKISDKQTGFLAGRAKILFFLFFIS